MADRPTDGSATVPRDPAASVGDETVTVLHVDDEPDFASVVEEFLERTNQAIEVLTESRVDAALDRLAAVPVDCVVSDYQMPAMNGLEFLEAVRERQPSLPFILFTGKGSEEIASEAISAGVTDYLQKGAGADQFEILANRIVNAVSRYRAERGLAARAEQQSVIASLGQQALERLDPAELLDDVVDAIEATLGVPFVTVLELDADGGVLRPRAWCGWAVDTAGETTVAAEGETQASHTLAVNDPVVVTDLETETRFSGPPVLPGHDVTSGVSVVIGPAADPWGVLAVHTTERRRFTDDEVAFVQSAANVIGGAVKRHDVEARLREGQERFRRMAEASPDVIFRIDRAGRFTYASPVVEEVLGYDRPDLEGEHFGRLVEDSSIEAATEGFQTVLAGEPVEGLRVEVERAEGGSIWMEINAVPLMAEGTVDEVLGFTRDVTAEMEHERALAEREELFRAVFEAALEPMVLADDHGTYVDANPAACELFGVDREALIGARIDEFVPADVDDAWAGFDAAEATRGTFPLVRADGSRREVEYASTRDVVSGLHLSILRDVTPAAEG